MIPSNFRMKMLPIRALLCALGSKGLNIKFDTETHLYLCNFFSLGISFLIEYNFCLYMIALGTLMILQEKKIWAPPAPFASHCEEVQVPLAL